MFYKCLRVLAVFIMRVVFRWSVRGAENLPPSGGVILVSNHASFWDPVFIGCCFKRKVHFMAKRELFRIPLFNLLIAALGAYPVKRGVPDKAAFDASFQRLRNGQVVGLFPEGTRFKDGRLHEMRPGAAVLGVRGNYPIIPLIIKNSHLIRWFRFPKISVEVGEPFYLPAELAGASEKERLQRATELIREKMTALWVQAHKEASANDGSSRGKPDRTAVVPE